MENLKKIRSDCRGETQLVKMGGIPSLERFQAQSIWEMSARPFLKPVHRLRKLIKN
jgi:hypothetical protein